MTARLSVRVHPGARGAGLVGWMEDGTLKLAVAAAPEGGKANRAVEALIADALGVKARQVKVTRGLASRSKTIEVDGLAEDEVTRRLSARMDPEAAGGR